MIGSVLELDHVADRPRRREAVHLRHHRVHQDEVDVRVRPEELERDLAVLGVEDLDAALLEHAA